MLLCFALLGLLCEVEVHVFDILLFPALAFRYSPEWQSANKAMRKEIGKSHRYLSTTKHDKARILYTKNDTLFKIKYHKQLPANSTTH